MTLARSIRDAFSKQSAVLAASLLMSLVVLMSCGLTVAPAAPTPTPIIPPPTPHKTIVFCNDETGSYSTSYFHLAAKQFATWVGGLVTTNQSGASVYAQWITANSYEDSSTYVSFTVPEIGALPATPLPLGTFPALHENERSTAEAAATQTESAFASVSGSLASQIQAAQTTISQYTNAITKMPDHHVNGSDIWGCPQRATERFAERPGDKKYLIIASDLEEVGAQEKATVNLHGAAVIIIYLETDSVGSYNERTKFWKSSLLHDGASSVLFFRPGDTLPQQPF